MTNPGLGTRTSSPGSIMDWVTSRRAVDPLGVIIMLRPCISPYLEKYSATASLSSGIPAVGPYLFLPARAAPHIPSTAACGGSMSGSPRPRLMDPGPARSNIFLMPDIGISVILLEDFMATVSARPIKGIGRGLRRGSDLTALIEPDARCSASLNVPARPIRPGGGSGGRPRTLRRAEGYLRQGDPGCLSGRGRGSMTTRSTSWSTRAPSATTRSSA